jgi:hypothetical protein
MKGLIVVLGLVAVALAAPGDSLDVRLVGSWPFGVSMAVGTTRHGNWPSSVRAEESTWWM